MDDAGLPFEQQLSLIDSLLSICQRDTSSRRSERELESSTRREQTGSSNAIHHDSDDHYERAAASLLVEAETLLRIFAQGIQRRRYTTGATAAVETSDLQLAFVIAFQDLTHRHRTLLEAYQFRNRPAPPTNPRRLYVVNGDDARNPNRRESQYARGINPRRPAARASALDPIAEADGHGHVFETVSEPNTRLLESASDHYPEEHREPVILERMGILITLEAIAAARTNSLPPPPPAPSSLHPGVALPPGMDHFVATRRPYSLPVFRGISSAEDPRRCGRLRLLWERLRERMERRRNQRAREGKEGGPSPGRMILD